MTAHDFLESIRSDRRAIAQGAVAGIGVFLLFGVVTGLVPNPLYVRMVPREPVDYLLLALTALLAGTYITQRIATESRLDGESDDSSDEDRWVIGGLIGGFLAVGCPICNIFLLALFSSSTLMTYFDPLRPALGALSVALLAGLIWVRHRRTCPTCQV
ncbi:hypothetical protein [Natrinema gelatinilyticum]|uniref:hypothetical protein n=1 Tax=Natrinema gelatinilyticum TaxID=2961571 RepID=UPI0020C3DA8B|nr:hypothetical protein [Natrinema gelatinilyticum]